MLSPIREHLQFLGLLHSSGVGGTMWSSVPKTMHNVIVEWRGTAPSQPESCSTQTRRGPHQTAVNEIQNVVRFQSRRRSCSSLRPHCRQRGSHIPTARLIARPPARRYSQHSL